MPSNGSSEKQRNLTEALEAIASIEDQLGIEEARVRAGLRIEDDEYYRWVKRAKKALRRAQTRRDRVKAELGESDLEVSCPVCGAKVPIL